MWCGIIDECIKTAKEWKKYFKNFMICVDHSKTENDTAIHNFKSFYDAQKNVTFCAVKHREGSDIPNLDCCIFMDKVETRSSKLFVQCIGRVLRKDKNKNKKYGLIIDIKAKSSINICNRIQTNWGSKISIHGIFQYNR